MHAIRVSCYSSQTSCYKATDIDSVQPDRVPLMYLYEEGQMSSPFYTAQGTTQLQNRDLPPDLMTSQPATSWPSTSHLQQSVWLFVNMEQDYQ